MGKGFCEMIIHSSLAYENCGMLDGGGELSWTLVKEFLKYYYWSGLAGRIIIDMKQESGN